MRSATTMAPIPPRLGQHNGELVAAEPRHDVGFAGAAADDGRRLDERPAAGQVPVVSLTLLNPSRSMNSSDSGRPLRIARLVSRRSTRLR